MTSGGTNVMPDANNITITTALIYCDDPTSDLNKTTYDLRNLYENNLTSNVFFNISIINFNCTSGVENFFQQMITFTQAVSIRIQILFASIYFDYINAIDYQLNGFVLDSDTPFDLSSITVNNSNTTNACSSAEIAQDSLCPVNSICNTLSNPWNFTCSQEFVTTTSVLEMAVGSSGLSSWRLGLICGFSILFVLLLILVSAFFYRRFKHSKNLALSHENIFDDAKITQKIGTPQGQAFHRVTTIVQPKRTNHTATSWIHDAAAANIVQNADNYINIRPPGPHNQVTFVDHAKVHDPGLPSNIPQPSITLGNITNVSSSRIGSTVTSRTVSGTSVTQLKLITDGLQEDKLNESDNISLDQPISNGPKKTDTPPSSEKSTNPSFGDENLRDEDAWMPILEVVNNELAKLNAQDRITTSM